MRDVHPHNEIATRVRDAIRTAGLTQIEVARRLDWPQQRLARRLTAAAYRVDFTAQELAEVAGVLGVPIADLMPATEPEPAGGASR